MAKFGGVAIYVRNGIPCKVKLLTEIGSQIEYLFLDILSTNKKNDLLVSIHRPLSNLFLIPSFLFLGKFPFNMTTLLLLATLREIFY